MDSSILALHGRLGSWKAVGEVLGVGGGYAWNVANGKIRRPDLEVLARSSHPAFLRAIRERVVPELRRREQRRA